MANQCAICGADINLIQTQKLSDGNCICRKNCRKKGFKVYDYVHSNLPSVKAHLAQVERGTKLWDHYFVPREKAKDIPHHSGQYESKAENGPLPGGCKQLHKG